MDVQIKSSSSMMQMQPLELLCKKSSFSFAIFAGKQLCQSFFFNKETLTQAFSSEFFEIFRKTYFIEHLWTTAFYDVRVSFI